MTEGNTQPGFSTLAGVGSRACTLLGSGVHTDTSSAGCRPRAPPAWEDAGPARPLLAADTNEVTEDAGKDIAIGTGMAALKDQ